MWIYKNKIGLLRIYPDHDMFTLVLNDELLGRYSSAVAAADDVYTQHTGHYKLDNFSGNLPSDLSEWEFIPS